MKKVFSVELQEDDNFVTEATFKCHVDGHLLAGNLYRIKQILNRYWENCEEGDEIDKLINELNETIDINIEEYYL